MTAILVDDEKYCRDFLALLLQRHCPQIQVLALCANAQEGLWAVQKYDPELIFLDIEMPDMGGFDFLDACGERKMKVIFSSGHCEYAIKAFRRNALDYIVKPVDKKELMQAVAKAERSGGLREAPTLRLKQDDRVALPTMAGFEVIDCGQICYCESDGGYTRFFLMNSQVIMTSKNLGEVAEVLDKKGFCRVHHSYLINLRYVKRYFRGDGGEVMMADDKTIPVSRSKKQEFLLCLERI